MFDTLSPLPLQWSLGPQKDRRVTSRGILWRRRMENTLQTRERMGEVLLRQRDKGACAVVKGISLPKEKN